MGKARKSIVTINSVNFKPKYMIDIAQFLEKNQTSVKEIIASFENLKEFSSHDFIEKFSEKFEPEYIDMLSKYKTSGQAFQTVNSQIAKYLSENMSMLELEKTSRKQSENVHGNIDRVQWWIRKAK